MAERIPQSTTIRIPLQAYLASDHFSPATGKTIAITISKNGAAYGNPSAGATNAVEIASGSYYVDLSTTDTGTLGPLFVRGAVATVDDVITIYNVVAATNGGFTALPAAAADAAGGLPISDAGGLDLDARLDAAISDVPTAIENADALLNRDMSVGTDSGSTTLRTPRQALRQLRNKWTIATTTLTVFKEDDTTASWTGTVSTDAAAVPIIGNDPTG